MPEYERILIVRTDRLGDVILTLPLLPLLRQRYPTAHIAMLVNRYAGAIVEGNPFVDELLWYDGSEGPLPFGTMLRALRRQKYDACIVVHPRARLALLMFLARIAVRVGSGYRFYSLLFNRRVYTHRRTAERHELEYNLELLGQLGCTVPSGIVPDFSIMVPDVAVNRVNEILTNFGIDTSQRVVIVHPGTGGSAREWPLEHFGLLAALLAENFKARLLVTGSAGETARVQDVVAAAGGRAVSLAGILTLKEMAALIKRCALFVSNSTGPLHLAVAVGTPVLAFFSQIPVMGSRRWGPYTHNARVLVPDKPLDCSACTGEAGSPCPCMASITVEAALAAATELLSRSPATMRPVLHAL